MPPLSAPEAFFTCLRDPEVTPPEGMRADLPKAVLKQVQPLGHEIQLWSSAHQILKSRLEKGRLDTELSTFLQQVWPTTTPEVKEGRFVLLLQETSEGWQLAAGSPTWLSEPAFSALLHLPALRPAWAAELRGSHFEHLRRVIPQAWFLDPTPLPPGSVIAGLGIPSWQALQSTGREFEIHSTSSTTQLTAEMTPEIWQASVREALSSGSARLSQRQNPTSWLLACYVKDTSGTHLQTAWMPPASEV